jgi:hypothetical protein
VSRVSLEKKIGIEPLGETRWARVERAVLSAVSEDGEAQARHLFAPKWAAPRWRGVTALVVSGAAAAVLGAVAWRSLEHPEAPLGPARIATAAIGSRVEVGESTVDVGPQSTVRLAGDDEHGISVLLDTGRVECDVAPRRGRPPFLVEAGMVEVRVIGTHFVVTRAGDAVSVDVQRGRVEVISGQEHAFVDAGAHWPGLGVSTSPAGLGTAGGPLSGSKNVPPPPSVALNAGSSVGARAANADGNGAGSSDTAPALEAPLHTVAADARVPASPVPVRLSPRERYDAASKIEAQKPDQAAAVYADLARQGGAWGMNALFAEGRLEADRGHTSEATRLLEEYLGRYPVGPNAEDARRLLARIR